MFFFHIFEKKYFCPEFIVIHASGRYDKKEDFTVVIQPTLIQGSVPKKNGIIDLEFLGPDCFHFSQRTHALGKKIYTVCQQDFK